MQDKQPGKELFIAARWHTIFKEIDVCIGDGFDSFKKEDGKYYYSVYNSIAPKIKSSESWWLPIPDNDNPVWHKFDVDTYDKDSFYKVIFKLYNGSVYAGYICKYTFTARPSFSISRYADLDAVEMWMEISPTDHLIEMVKEK